MTSLSLQQRAALLVEREVHLCVSSIVSTLAYGFPDDLAGTRTRDYPGWGLREQAAELASPVLDYESAAREAGWRPNPNGRTSWVWKDEYGHDCAPSWQDACAADDIEPRELEVYEHWAVSTWLAENLIEQGERVDTDFTGWNVWARTATGQSISADVVIERIVTATKYASA